MPPDLANPHRRKKCDEEKPQCRRCIKGDFQCLGYDSPADDCVSKSTHKAEVGFLRQPSHINITEDVMVASSTVLNHLIPLPQYTDEPGQSPEVHAPVQKFATFPSTLPRNFALDPITLEDATSFIMSQFVCLSQKLLFKPLSTPIEQGLLWRIEYSEFTRWSMYLSARVLKDMSNGINGQKYAGWIFRFCQRILESSSSAEPASSMDGRLGGLHDLAYLGFIVSGTAVGYSLFQRCTPTFLGLAGLFPDLWSDNSTIFILKAVRSRYEIIKFVVNDTIIAIILGIPPQLHYDTTPASNHGEPNRVLELVYGIPSEILFILAKVNAWRASRLMGEGLQNYNDQRDIERTLSSWTLVVEHTDEPIKDIARSAVQEAWRQAAMIYFYMGMRGVNSADPQVQKAVRQVVQLGNVIEPGSPLERHLLIPCVIVGIAARQEKHRATLRNKVISKSFLHEITTVLRISEFVVVLDHLWHGAGKGGNPVMWDDYVHSRCATIPIPY
ncbi:unnamed protein product [Rhizoctonia solani]|uniref:Zn(2)-C6 fungal-type domain-containing protein n=1 Tax=Rhizoctonia solani TaxID=456999 RepID=A0A8H3GFY1_9AGAM|nr:unnamed protein product [Rhizoctonia solani]